MRHRRTVIIVISLLVGGCVIASGIATRRALDPFAEQSFSSSAWIGGTPVSRAAMARDVVRRLTPGMTEAQVVAMLGKPEEVVLANRDAGGNHVLGPRAYTYYLGGWSMRGMDSAFVFVHLDANDRVIKSEIDGY